MGLINLTCGAATRKKNLRVCEEVSKTMVSGQFTNSHRIIATNGRGPLCNDWV